MILKQMSKRVITLEKLSNKKENELKLIPKAEKYVEYMLSIIFKIPRTEKFSIGTEYKTSMYQMLENIIYLNKIETHRLEILNKIDAELSIQRIYLRIMFKNAWIDRKKFDYSINLIYEIGKIVGGLTKSYGKNNKE